LDLLRALDADRIGTRLLFAGNLVRQPSMEGCRYRIAGTLTNTDRIMERTFWIGLYPGLGREALSYVCDLIRDVLLRPSHGA
jgi:CDP-6-deoxy-D-xylo-4-hexulose-3-dehydrase